MRQVDTARRQEKVMWGAGKKAFGEWEHRFYVEFIDHCNDHKQTYIYMLGKNPEQIRSQMEEYEIILIDQTD